MVEINCHSGERGHGGQHKSEPNDDKCSLCGREGVDVGEFRPRDGDHFRSGVELHGARAEADHGRVEREVLVLEALEVAQHLGLLTKKTEEKNESTGRAEQS